MFFHLKVHSPNPKCTHGLLLLGVHPGKVGVSTLISDLPVVYTVSLALVCHSHSKFNMFIALCKFCRIFWDR